MNKYMNKLIGMFGVLGIVGIIVAGCGTPAAHSDGPPPEFLQEKYQKLSDGRTVMCLYKESGIGGYSTGKTMALSCDWAGAIVHTEK